MRRSRLFWQLYPLSLGAAMLVVFIIAANSWWALRSLDRVRREDDLHGRARLVSQLILPALHRGDYAAIDAVCKEVGHTTRTRYTITLPSGQVIGDTDAVPGHMENHSARPEIRQALATGSGSAIRYSDTLRQEMLYTAVAVRESGVTLGTVRGAFPLLAINQALREYRRELLLVLTIVILITVLVNLTIVRRITRPIDTLKRGAIRFAHGDLAQRLYVDDAVEFSELAAAVNDMAIQLGERIRTAVRQRNQHDAILMSMLEGILAVDQQDRILTVNQAAGRLLYLDTEWAPGRLIHEAIRNRDLQRFISEALAAQQPCEAEILLREHGECILQVRGTMLHDENQQRMGALIVMNDVTHLRRLERMRRDFVANVSHELKTPITSIKGFAETLRDGDMQDGDDTRQFLEIICKHTDRLNAIIDDLLSLSRIEQQTERAEILLEELPIAEPIRAALLTCAHKAEEKAITLLADCAPTLRVYANRTLLEQAVFNLLDNAIKYSDPAHEVRLAVSQVDGEICVSIHDQGYGIAGEHLPRLFERFYRVDTSRSRKLGGTGLGLAIVKHIMQAHHGRVTVESTPGIGSTFTLHLPAQERVI